MINQTLNHLPGWHGSHGWLGVTWKRLNTETTQHGNASKKQNHKTNLMSSSLNLKLKRLYSTDFHSHGRSARSPSLF